MTEQRHQVPTEPRRVGMDELSFFVQMVKTFSLNKTDETPDARDKRFWLTVHKHCPNLIWAIGTSFTGQWSEITFTRSIHSAAFMTDDSSDCEQEPQEREGTPE